MGDSVPEQFRPRLCHIVKWDDFPGYGFNLHAEKGKAGQFIGKVDAKSPAEAAGLKEGDRIVEVNGINIGNENHQQVVTRIRSGGEETRLLVVDTESDNWYKDQKKVVRGDLPEVVFRSAQRDQETDQSPAYDEEDTPAQQEPEPEPEQVYEPPTEAAVETVVAAPPVTNGGVADEDYAYRPRLCHLKLWPHFQGYGFNLHAERDKPGQYIGLVDDNSPASTAGLMVNDRIVEVNGVNIEAETHTDVIARIKAVPGETRLLVVDRDTDMYYREKGATVSSSMPQTLYQATPDAADIPTELEGIVEVEAQLDNLQVDQVEGGIDKEEEREDEEEDDIEGAVIGHLANIPPPPAEEEEEKEKEPEEVVNGGPKSQAPIPPAEPEPEFTVASHEPARVEPQVAYVPAPAQASAQATDGLELNLSVAEMKERLKAKKRQDPRLNKISFEQKYKEFQRM